MNEYWKRLIKHQMIAFFVGLAICLLVNKCIGII